jgi:K+-sensing histidine kinase KdpD
VVPYQVDRLLVEHHEVGNQVITDPARIADVADGQLVAVVVIHAHERMVQRDRHVAEAINGRLAEHFGGRTIDFDEAAGTTASSAAIGSSEMW